MEKNKITYAEAMEEIESILAQLNDEKIDIDTLAGKVKRAGELIKLCRTKLRKAEEDVEKILKDGE